MNTLTLSHPEIVVHTGHDVHITHVAAQMLANAGYHVVQAESPDRACDLAVTGYTELLILSGDLSELSLSLDRLATQPQAQRPRHVAILSDDLNDTNALLNRKLPGTKVHLFITPLQAYGLLNVVHRIRSRATHAN